MKKLVGLNEYLKQNSEKSFFDSEDAAKEFHDYHIHGQKVISAKVIENYPFDVSLIAENGQNFQLKKLEIKFITETSNREKVLRQIQVNNHVRKMNLKPILSNKHRNHVKNKSLYPLMKDKVVLFFTSLEGEVLRGIVSGFSKYEININLKGGIPVVFLRHAIYDVRDKKNRCYLKRVQEKTRDWQKSAYFKDV